MKNTKKKYIVYFTLILILGVLVLSKFGKNKGSLGDNFIQKTKVFYINLDKNVERRTTLMQSYQTSDINLMPITRFSAIAGRDVNLEQWLTPNAITQLNNTELTKTRTHHYQLTNGAVGCFLSHLTLAKQLVNDSDAEYYIIFEDDLIFKHNTLNEIHNYLLDAPKDWDVILLSSLRKIKYTEVGQFFKPEGFWGTQGYIINKKGAKKLVKEVEKNKIDAQIDAYMSRMIQEYKLNLYITNKHLIDLTNSGSDIQMQVKVDPRNNPFIYKGYFV